MEHHSLSWEAPEYHFIERTNDWYWMLGIITLSLAVLCIIFGNVLFGLFVLLAGLTLGLYAGREPNLIRYELQPKGVLAGHTFYMFKSLESFWIDEHHALPRIILKSKKTFMLHIIIPFAHIPPEEIREYLIAHIPEIESHESWAHRFVDHLGL